MNIAHIQQILADGGNVDADIDITDNTTVVSRLYVRKQDSYTENRIYPMVRLEEDLRPDLAALKFIQQEPYLS